MAPWLAFAALACSTPPARPNIVVIALDTMRADRIGAYGNADGLMPNLDELAKDSVVFDRTYAQSTETLFSFGSFFTGRYPSEIGPSTHEWRVPATMPTLAEVLGTYGYAASAFVAGGQLDPVFGLDRGFEPYVTAERNFASLGATRDPALAWIAEARDGPFFTLVHGYDMHARYWKPPPAGSPPPEAGIARSLVLHAMGAELVIGNRATPQSCFPILANGNARILIEEDDPSDPLVAQCLSAQIPVGEADLQSVRAAYDGAARWTDAQLGLFLGGLEELGRFEDTWIIVLADHGESLGEDGTFGHRHTIADDVVHVPLLVRPPGGVAGRHVTGLAELTDVTATILAIAGASPPAESRGTSLLPAIEGADGSGRRVAVTESWSQATRITSDRDTYLSFEGLGWDNPMWSELLEWAPAQGPSFGRSHAPGEGELERLRADLIAWRARTPLAPPMQSAPDPAFKEALRKGGYWSP